MHSVTSFSGLPSVLDYALQEQVAGGCPDALLSSSGSIGREPRVCSPKSLPVAASDRRLSGRQRGTPRCERFPARLRLTAHPGASGCSLTLRVCGHRSGGGGCVLGIRVAQRLIRRCTNTPETWPVCTVPAERSGAGAVPFQPSWVQCSSTDTGTIGPMAAAMGSPRGVASPMGFISFTVVGSDRSTLLRSRTPAISAAARTPPGEAHLPP